MVLRAKRILSPGTQIAGYRIEAELGQGAMAVVYRAVQLNLDRRVALKVLSDELAANQEFVGRFFNEARAAAALSHAHIIQAYDAGVTDDNIYYFAMEYVEGETLQQRIRRQGYVRPGPGIDLAADIADALNYGWQRQHLTHGDIKPENIMINRAEESKLADFGLAKVAGHDFDGSDIMLTPLYAAPEMIRGQHAKGDCRADIYAFGATLYHMFGGTPPFPGEKAQEVMQRHLTEPLEPLRQRNPAVPRRISDLVGSLLAKEPAQRPGEWESVLMALREIRRVLTEPPAAKVVTAAATPIRLKGVRRAKALGTTAAPRRRNSAGVWATVLVSLIAVAVAGVMLVGRYRSTRMSVPDGESAPAASPGTPSATPDVGGEGTSPPVVASPVAEEWRALCGEVSKMEDPGRALTLVLDFGRRHRDELPADYATALAERQAAALAVAPAALAATADTAPRTPEPPGAVTERAPDPDPAGAQAAPSQPPAVPPGPAADDGPGPADVDKAAAAPLDGGLSDRVPVAMTSADRCTDAFLGYMAHLSRLEYSVPFRVEATVEMGQKWLLEYGQDSPERSQVAFCVNTALPALDEVVAKLAASTDLLAGAKLPQREYSRCTVREVAFAGLVLQEQTQHGVMLRNVAWQRLDNAVAVVFHLSRLVAAKSATWRDRRPFLALLLFTRNGKFLEEAVAGLPETPEKADWVGLRTALGSAAEDGKALKLWQKAVEACEQGERTAACRLLMELQATRSSVSERYSQRIAQLIATVGQGVPEVAGGRLVREAAEAVAADPTAALAKLLLAEARYGDTDFPEKARLDRLRRGALAAVPLPEWLLQSVRRYPQQVIVPFAQPPSAGIPALAMRTYLVACDGLTDLPPRIADLVPWLEGPALTELGDWNAASRCLAKLTDTAMGSLPPATRAAACYSRALVDARYGQTPARDVLEALRQAARDQSAGAAEGQFALLPQILAIEYGLCERSGVPEVAPYLLAADSLRPRGPIEPRTRLVLDLAALAIDRHQADSLAGLIPAAFGQGREGSEWGLTQADLQMLRLGRGTARDPQALAAAMADVPGRDLCEGHLRIAVSAALARDALDEAVWLKATEWVEMKGSTFGPVGGSAVYDLVVLRVANLLAASNDEQAAETVAWALNQGQPCLAPYYARMLFLRWGLLRLHGDGGSRELAEQVGAATSASRTEKAIARLYTHETLRDKAKEAAKEGPEARFWYDWLVTCDRVGQPGQGGPAERLATTRLPRSEQALAAALAGRAKG